jgi:hypothetical protein
MRKRKLGAIAVVLMLGMFVAGCPKGAYHDAVVAEHDMKSGVAAFQQAEMQEYQAGRIDLATHQQLEAGVEKVGLAAQVLVSSLQAGAANTTVQQNFDTMGQAVNDLLANGVLGVKDTTSKQVLKTLIETIQAILKNIGSLLSVQTTTTVGGN